MTKIFFIGDTHFGKSYPYRKNYTLNISERSLDVIDNCERIIQAAIHENADYVIFLGDLYHRKIISPTIRKIIREKIFIPLNEAKIKTFVIGGNHDSVRNPKRGVDIQELSSFSNVDVYTNLGSRVIEIDDLKLGLIFLPYLRFDVLVEVAKENEIFSDGESDGSDNYILAQTILQQYVANVCEGKLKDCDTRILMGHYYLDGAKIRESNNPTAIYGEFKFTKDMVQREFFDLVIFGHVHLKQTVWNDDRMVIPGSIDRIDMGERDSEKFYCVYEVEEDLLEFRKIDCRPMIKKNIEVPDEMEEITQYILENLPEKDKVKDAVSVVSISYPKAQEIKIDKSQIEKYFSNAFNADIIYTEKPTEELRQLREMNLDPISLYNQFLEQHYDNNKYFEELKEIGLDLLQKQFTSVDMTTKGPISIKSIDLQNFNKYGRGPNKIVFDKDSYVITGPTGSGKSSILDAITFALFKKSSRRDSGLKLDEILYQGGYVSLEILIGDSNLHITRKQTNPKLQIKLDGNSLYTGLSIPEKEKNLENIIGYDYEAFTSSFFIRQQELQIFSSLNSSDRHDRLIKLFKLGIFGDIYKDLKPKIDDFNKKHTTLEGQIKGLKPRVEELPEKENDLKEKNEQLEKKKKKKKELTDSLKKLREEVDKLQIEASKFVKVQTLSTEMQAEITQSWKEIKDYNDQQLNYTKLQKKLSKFKDFKELKEELTKQKEELEQILHKKEILESKLSNNKKLMDQKDKSYEDQIEKLSNDVQEKKIRLSSLDTSITKQVAFQMLRDDGKLTERFERLQTVEIPLVQEYNDQKRLKEFSSLGIKTKGELDALQPRLQGITKDIFLVEELKNEESRIKIQIDDLKDKKVNDFEVGETKQNKLKESFKESGFDNDIIADLEKNKDQMGEIQTQEQVREGLEAKLKKKKDFSTVIEKLEDDIKKKNNKLDEKENELKALKPSYDKFQAKTKDFNEMQTQISQNDSEIKEIEGNLEYLSKDIIKIKAIKEEIKDIVRETKNIKNEIEKYTLLRNNIFHSNGVPKFAIEQLLPAISIKASEILSDLTKGTLNQIVFKPIETKGRVGFEIFVFDGERDREANTFSGGEKTQINAAIRFAIMERIAEIPDTSGAIFRKSNTLFIDEGDLGTLDDETTRQTFVDKIFELQSMFKKIILITHLEDVVEQFPNRIIIGKDELGNSKIHN